jgi:hypothetical protein
MTVSFMADPSGTFTPKSNLAVIHVFLGELESNLKKKRRRKKASHIHGRIYQGQIRVQRSGLGRAGNK